MVPFELPVWTGRKGQSRVTFVTNISNVSQFTRRRKDDDFMTFVSGNVIFQNLHFLFAVSTGSKDQNGVIILKEISQVL